MLADDDALMTAAYRGFAGEESFRHRLLRRLMLIYFNNSPQRRDLAGVQLRTGGQLGPDGKMRWQAKIARAITRMMVNPVLGGHVFTKKFPPFYGSTWFGARRHVVEWMLNRFDQPDIQSHFPKLCIADEFLIPSMLKQSGFKSGPMNHCILTFIEANPSWLTDSDFEALKQSPCFFGRKFPDDIHTPIRMRILTELVGMKPEQVLPDNDMAAHTPVQAPVSTTV